MYMSHGSEQGNLEERGLEKVALTEALRRRVRIWAGDWKTFERSVVQKFELEAITLGFFGGGGYLKERTWGNTGK